MNLIHSQKGSTPDSEKKKWKKRLKLSNLLTPKRKRNSKLQGEGEEGSSQLLDASSPIEHPPLVPSPRVSVTRSNSGESIHAQEGDLGASGKARRRSSAPFKVIKNRIFPRRTSSGDIQKPSDAQDIRDSFSMEDLMEIAADFDDDVDSSTRPSLVRPPSISNLDVSQPKSTQSRNIPSPSNHSVKSTTRMEIKQSPRATSKKTPLPADSWHAADDGTPADHTLSQKLKIGERKSSNPSSMIPRSPRPMATGAKPVNTTQHSAASMDSSFHPTLSQKLRIGMEKSQIQRESIMEANMAKLMAQNATQLPFTHSLGSTKSTDSKSGAPDTVIVKGNSTHSSITAITTASSTMPPSSPRSKSNNMGSPTSVQSKSATHHRTRSSEKGRPPKSFRKESNRPRSRTPDGASRSTPKSPSRRRKSSESDVNLTSNDRSTRSRSTVASEGSHSRSKTPEGSSSRKEDTPLSPTSVTQSRRRRSTLSKMTEVFALVEEDIQQSTRTTSRRRRSKEMSAVESAKNDGDGQRAPQRTNSSESARSRSNTPEGSSRRISDMKSPTSPHRRRAREYSKRDSKPSQGNEAETPSQVDADAPTDISSPTSPSLRRRRKGSTSSRSRESESRSKSREKARQAAANGTSPPRPRSSTPEGNRSSPSKPERKASGELKELVRSDSGERESDRHRERGEARRKGSTESRYRTRGRADPGIPSPTSRSHHKSYIHHSRHSDQNGSNLNSSERRRTRSREIHSNGTSVDHTDAKLNSDPARKHSTGKERLMSWGELAKSDSQPVGPPRDNGETSPPLRVMSKAERDRRGDACKTPTTPRRPRIGSSHRNSPASASSPASCTSRDKRSKGRRSFRKSIQQAIPEPDIIQSNDTAPQTSENLDSSLAVNEINLQNSVRPDSRSADSGMDSDILSQAFPDSQTSNNFQDSTKSSTANIDYQYAANSPNLTREHFDAVNAMAVKEFHSPLTDKPPMTPSSERKMTRTQALKKHLRQLEDLNRQMANYSSSIGSGPSAGSSLHQSSISDNRSHSNRSYQRSGHGANGPTARRRRHSHEITALVLEDDPTTPTPQNGVMCMSAPEMNTSPFSDDSSSQRLTRGMETPLAAQGWTVDALGVPAKLTPSPPKKYPAMGNGSTPFREGHVMEVGKP